MGTYTRFLYEFLAQFFAGLITILGGIGKGIGQLFNIPGYAKIIDHYKNDFSMAEWVLGCTSSNCGSSCCWYGICINILFNKKKIFKI